MGNANTKVVFLSHEDAGNSSFRNQLMEAQSASVK